MKCKMFSSQYLSDLERDVNNFLGSGDFVIVQILQTEGFNNNIWNVTVTIFYR